MGRRLIIAIALIIVIAVACWVVLPRYGLVMPMIVPVLLSVVMVFAVLAPSLERPARAPEPDELDAARPMCCSGPRPVGETTSRMSQRGGCGCR